MPTKRSLYARLAAPIVGVTILAMTACSSGAPTTAATAKPEDKAVIAEAQGLVDAATPLLPWDAPGGQFTAAAKLTGGTFTFVSVDLASQYSTALGSGISQGAELFGATVNSLDAKGDPTAASRQISSAVSSGSSAILIQGFPSALLKEPIKAAAAAGIPVIMINEVEASEPTSAQAELGVFGNATSCFSCGGTLMADMAVAQYGSSVNAAFIGASSLGEVAIGQQQAFEKELSRLCDECSLKTLDIGIAKWATDVTPAVTSALSDRKLNVIAPLYDLQFPFVLAAINAAQAKDRVSVVSVDGTQPGLVDLAKGKPVLGDIGSSATQLGWTAFDQALRAINGQKPATNSMLPMRVFTTETAGKLDLDSSAEESWFTDANLKSEFSKLWGLS